MLTPASFIENVCCRLDQITRLPTKYRLEICCCCHHHDLRKPICNNGKVIKSYNHLFTRISTEVVILYIE